MKSMLHKAPLIAGVLLVLYSIFMAVVSNFNLGILVTLALGIFLAASGTLWRWLGRVLDQRWVALMRCVVATVLLFACGVALMLVIVGHHDTAAFDEDALVVLGAGIHGETVSVTLQHRLDRAIDYWHLNPNVVLVVSGGQGPQEHISEALAMQRYLVANGVPEGAILMEARSTSTYENFKFSKDILDDAFPNGYSVAYVTNGFHIYRAGRIAKLAGLSSRSVAAKTEWYTLPVCYVREALVVVKSWVFGYY